MISPLAAKTSGIKEALSILWTAAHKLCAFPAYACGIDGCHLLRQVGRGARVKNPYIKKINACSNQFPPKPLALISSLASSTLMLVLMSSTSPVRSCKEGSMVTSVHTPFNKSAVMPRSSLWRMDGYPSPVEHDSAWPMVNACPQAQSEAGCGEDQP